MYDIVIIKIYIVYVIVVFAVAASALIIIAFLTRVHGLFYTYFREIVPNGCPRTEFGYSYIVFLCHNI